MTVIMSLIHFIFSLNCHRIAGQRSSPTQVRAFALSTEGGL